MSNFYCSVPFKWQIFYKNYHFPLFKNKYYSGLKPSLDSSFLQTVSTCYVQIDDDVLAQLRLIPPGGTPMEPIAGKWWSIILRTINLATVLTYEVTVTLFSGMTSMSRLHSWNSLNVFRKLTNHPFSNQFDIMVIEEPIKVQNCTNPKAQFSSLPPGVTTICRALVDPSTFINYRL